MLGRWYVDGGADKGEDVDSGIGEAGYCGDICPDSDADFSIGLMKSFFSETEDAVGDLMNW